MIEFTSRGHEIVDSTPVELSVGLGMPPRETIADKLRRMLYHEQMSVADTIQDEADLMEDLNDFSDDEGDANLLGSSSYEVPDDVPDAFSAAEYRENKKKENSVSKEDSGTESSGGTE